MFPHQQSLSPPAIDLHDTYIQKQLRCMFPFVGIEVASQEGDKQNQLQQ